MADEISQKTSLPAFVNSNRIKPQVIEYQGFWKQPNTRQKILR
jgi:hypothetical protein